MNHRIYSGITKPEKTPTLQQLHRIMKICPLFLCTALALATTIVPAADGRLDSPYGANRYGNSAPSSFTYGFAAPLSLGNTALGDIDSAELQGVWVAPVIRRSSFDILGGISYRRLQFGKPAGAPVPNSLQGIAGVIGAQSNFADNWRARIEAFPGLYSDFSDISGDDFTVPLLLETAYELNPSLELGAQLMMHPFRKNPVVGMVGITWLINDDWSLNFWLPRPQLEYQWSDDLDLFVGGSLSGGSFRVAEDFGTALGRPELNGEVVDFQEVRAGAGARFNLGRHITAEIAGGWIFDRRFEFYERNLTANGDGAPYVQFSLGARF